MRNRVLVTALLIVFIGCADSDKSDMEKARSDALMEMVISNIGASDKDAITLLAIKYELSTETAQGIIDEFMTNSTSHLSPFLNAKNAEEFNRIKNEYKNRPTVRNRVMSISAKYNIEPKIIASLLIDYELYQKSSPDSGNEFESESSEREPIETIR